MATPHNQNTCYNLQGNLFVPAQIDRVCAGEGEMQTDSDYGIPQGLNRSDEIARSYRTALAAWQNFKQAMERTDLSAEQKLQSTQHFARLFFQYGLGYNALKQISNIAVTDSIHPDEPLLYPVNFLLDQSTDALSSAQKLTETTVQSGTTQIVPLAGDGVHKASTILPLTVALADFDPKTKKRADLDTTSTMYAVQGEGQRKKAPFQMTQQLLNADPRFLWAFVFNGYSVRLLRDTMSIARPSYLEFNLEEIFSGDHKADFTQMWLLIHASRANVSDDGLNVWERWVKAGYTVGQPAREKLSVSLSDALDILGNGFLHTKGEGNAALCHKLATGELSAEDYNHQLLRLMYRFLFVFCLEEREIINTRMTPERAKQIAAERNQAARQAYEEVLAKAKDQSQAQENIEYQETLSLNEIQPPVDVTANDIRLEHFTAQQRYKEGYSLQRLRYQALKQRFQNDFCDAWEGACIVFEALAQGEQALALPALGGLFNHEQCVDLMASNLSNKDFFAAMRLMRWAYLNGSYTLIDYKNMDTEELGSLYEGMLELVPHIANNDGSLSFSLLDSSGNERKSTGSYYTPDFLVQNLIKTALDPVIAQKLKDNPQNPEQALLSLKVIDPACGSGHFLLAAARRIADELAQIRAQSMLQAPSPELYRHSLHEVISKCIYGVDVNPMAVELARMGLWLEGFAENEPLSFLDHHLQVGNALLGVMDLETVELGIDKDAYEQQETKFTEFSYATKEVCAALRKQNTAERKKLKKEGHVHYTALGAGTSTEITNNAFATLNKLKINDLENEKAKQNIFDKYCLAIKQTPIYRACDLQIAAYLCPKTSQTKHLVPTSYDLARMCSNDLIEANSPEMQAKCEFAHQVCEQNKVMHWPFMFPEAMSQGGFDCVLGNPPWEKPKIEDVKWFATRVLPIAKAKNTSERKSMIKALAQGKWAQEYPDDAKSMGLFNDTNNTQQQALDLLTDPATDTQQAQTQSKWEQQVFAYYMRDQYQAKAISNFTHLEPEKGARFPLTGNGDANLFALFAETAFDLRCKNGATGIVVPIGLMADKGSCRFCQKLFTNHQVSSIYHFTNTENIFPDVDGRYSFSLLTIRSAKQTDCVFYASNESHLDDTQRLVHFMQGDIPLINPNTKTVPLVRTKYDLKLCRKIYQHVPVFIQDLPDGSQRNPWQVQTTRMFDMSNDSYLFMTKGTPAYEQALQQGKTMLPLYEGKLFWQFDHRNKSYELNTKTGKLEQVYVTLEQKQQSSYLISPQYWVDASEVQDILNKKQWTRSWVLAFRKTASATNERTIIVSVLPALSAINDKAPILLPNTTDNLAACLLATLNSLTVDYVNRCKQAGTDLSLFYLKQLPILPPEAFTEQDVAFICERVAKLTRTAEDINDVWLTDYPAYIFQGPEERLQIRCELDAYIARMYGLTREELHYILDPADAMNDPTFPSVTFPGLKNKELKLYGEYRTQRLVIKAFDDLEACILK